MWEHNRKKCTLKRVKKEKILDEIILSYGPGEEVSLQIGRIEPEEWVTAVQGREVKKAHYVFLYRNDPDLHEDDKLIIGEDEFRVVSSMEQYHLMRKVVITWQRSL